MPEERILEPSEEYRARFKDDFKRRSEEIFEEYTKKSNIDVEENKKLCDKHYELCAYIKKINSKLALFNFLFIFLLVAAILCVIVGIYLITQETIYGVIPLAISPILFFLVFGPINKKKKFLKTEKERSEKLCDEAKNKADAIMKPFYACFTKRLPAEMLSGVNPIIKTFPALNAECEAFFNSEYNFSTEREANVSTKFALFGLLDDSPFLLERNRIMKLMPKKYTGTLTIHWTTTSRDSKGNTVTHHHTQTLVANVFHDAPFYSTETHLSYGNLAGPKLNFSRVPTKIDASNEREVKSLTKSTEKKLKSMAEKAISEGKGFTPMANTEFEALFNALDRNNELEFRLLFTPLAITNFFELLKDKSAYGDDFSFRKCQKMNYISSSHSQNIDYSGNLSNYLSFDYRIMKDKFLNYSQNYFKGLFYDLAPLLSIPVYQMTKAEKKPEDFKVSKLYSDIEAEIMANQLPESSLKHALSKTESIIKADLVSSDKISDTYRITAHSFRTEPRCDYVPTLGGDGRMHSVPVPWLEYFAVSKDTDLVLTKDETNSEKFDYYSVCERGIKASIK